MTPNAARDWANDWVIDADAHITEPGDLWSSRLPAKLRERGPQLRRDPETGRDGWHLGDSKAFASVGHTAGAVAGAATAIRGTKPAGRRK